MHYRHEWLRSAEDSAILRPIRQAERGAGYGKVICRMELRFMNWMKGYGCSFLIYAGSRLALQGLSVRRPRLQQRGNTQTELRID